MEFDAHHTLGIDTTFRHFDCTSSGLSTAEAAIRLKRDGPNTLPVAPPTPLLRIIFSQFKNPIILILLIAALISFGIGEHLDAWFILAVLIINAAIGTVLEHSADRQAHALRHSVTTLAKVLRDGKEELIDAAGLALGDIVVIESGDKVPADLRLIHTYHLSADESLLTGESLEVGKDATAIFDDPDLPLGDRSNMLFAGTYITSGRARGIVSAVGLHTQIGRIAELLIGKSAVKVPLIARLEAFSLKIAAAVGVISLLIIALSLFRGTPLLEVFFLTVALFVSAVPEGLPVAITVALASAAVAMSRRSVIVRKLPAIEALGSCTLIATDKTGTLTQNRLSVESFEGAADPVKALEAVVIANEAYRNRQGTFGGDQVDVALALYAQRQNAAILERMERPKTDLIPYEPAQKYSGAVIETETGYFAAVKGSPEVILAACSIDPSERDILLAEVNSLAREGYRLIGVAYADTATPHLQEAMASKHFIWAGLAAITDPLRDGVETALAHCHEAGITVVMVTGDHPETALHIAKRLNMAAGMQQVMDGEALSHWYENGGDPASLADIRVFARVSPEQKLQIVRAFQGLGHYVAVTGDGVNDAPALKSAHIGIAMGKSGTDVAKESADLILTDDAFTSIVGGVEEGRRAYDNIRKVVHLLISTGLAEIILVLLSLAFATPVPLLPIHLLWLNLVTNGIQDVALGLEPAEPHVLKRGPRPPKEPIFNALMIQRIVLGAAYMGLIGFGVFYTLLAQGVPVESARNDTLLLMVLFENLHAFNSRSETRYLFKVSHFKNLLLPLSIIAAQAVHIAAMQLPWTQQLLSLEPVSLQVWTELLLFSFGLVVVMEAEKFVRLRRK
ncbi:HAD-IC family P-type ATPase [Sulfurimonas sp. HSL-1656]|uniref:cation-translocating P-type ATPase n=1 Tax=Thiomicrolovo subterrani TaxID=3131934 RepID=UPI0031F787BA